MSDLRSSSLNVLRQEMTNTYNRLQSINRDALFVQKVAESGTLPVIPNLRCGAWYVDPTLMLSDPNASAYFKSTDGHTSQWSFNLRRANLHLLPIIESHGGIVLVDSTRRGKRHPDALSRTVPIWCAVINKALGLENEYSCLFTPPDAVSPSEHAQMEAKIQGWAQELNASAYTLPALAKPLRPFWISPDSSNPCVPAIDALTAYYPVVCVSASQRVQDGVDRRLGFTYVQGSGDDHEMWSQGLTPSLFWQHKSQLLSCSQNNLKELIQDLLNQAHAVQSESQRHPIQAVGGRLLVGARSSALVSDGSHEAYPTLVLTEISSKSLELEDACNPVKTASDPDIDELSVLPKMLQVAGYYPKQYPTQFLTHTLPISLEFIRSHLTASPNSRIVILCKDGKDLSPSIATAALAMYFDDSGEFTGSGTYNMGAPNKDTIRRRLQWVLSSCPGANPARATLRRINEYLMSPNRPSLQKKTS